MIENCNPDHKRLKPVVEHEPLIDPDITLKFVISKTGGIELSCGRGKLRIPSQTLEAIQHLPPTDKERIDTCLFNALDDSPFINLIPKK